MKTPQFSIVIPTLNEEKFLPHLLESLTKQTHKNFEVIVVDGSSKDKTLAVARSFIGKIAHLKIIVSKKAHASLQRNVGAREARGRFLVFFDADDVIFPHALDRMSAYIGVSEDTFFTTWISPDRDTPGDSLSTLLGNMLMEGSILVKRALAPGCCFVVSKKLFDRVGGFDETIKVGEDYNLTKRIEEAGIPMTILRETLYIYSLRRMRREGNLKIVQIYLRAFLLALLTKKSLGNDPSYVMGGQLYDAKHTKRTKSFMQTVEQKFKTFIGELFE